MDGMRFIIREDASEMDAFWTKPHRVRPTDLDCTDMDPEAMGEIYQAKLDARKAVA